jgi:hypothetical protein
VVYLEVYSHFLATSGPASKAAERKLWAALLAYVAAETVVTVTDFHDSFRKNYEIMNNFLGLNFGLDDINPKGLDLDSALAQSMLSFYHDILAFDDSFSDERARMVQKAWDMVGYDDEFLVCLKQLVGPTLAKVWHPFIRDLGQTRVVYHTVVRAVKMSPLFGNISIHLTRAPSSLSQVHSPATPRPTKTTPDPPACQSPPLSSSPNVAQAVKKAPSLTSSIPSRTPSRPRATGLTQASRTVTQHVIATSSPLSLPLTVRSAHPSTSPPDCVRRRLMTYILVLAQTFPCSLRAIPPYSHLAKLVG